jgi:hypothetical protein
MYGWPPHTGTLAAVDTFFVDTYLNGYNHHRPRQGRGMNGRTPAPAFKEGLPKPKPTKRAKTPKDKAA